MTTPTRARGLLVAALLGAGATSAGIALTTTSGWLIVRASERPVILTLMVAIVGVRAFGMARPALRYLERLRSHDTALRTLVDERQETYTRLIPLTPARLGQRRRTDVLTAATEDLDDVVQAQVRATVPMLTALITVGLTGALTALLEPGVGLAIAGLLLAAAVVCAISAHREASTQTSLLRTRAEVTRIAELAGARGRDLRSVGAQQDALRWIDDAHARLAVGTTALGRVRAAAVAQLSLATGATVLVVAFVVASTTWAAPIKGLLLLTPVAVGEALVPLVDASRAYVRARGAQARLDTLLALDPAVTRHGHLPVTDHERPPLLELRGVYASWSPRGEARAGMSTVGPLDLVLAPGSTTLITGANGSGKSTLLAILARHLDPVAGHYEVDGTDALTLDLEALRARFAVVDDEPYVLGTTLRENLRLANPDATDLDLVSVLDRAGLAPWWVGLPEGLETRLGSGGRGISGGERARLSIARALLSGRPVILLDEPTAHLDPPTARAVLVTLLDAAADRTVVVVSHQPLPPDRFDHVVVLSAREAVPQTTAS
ncbi:MAG: thiol reductant ABC exporter subunit CydC [Lapillicoccus sp.]